MKKLFVFILLLVYVSSEVNAQAKPAYSQYILNNYILNPALAGIENYTDIKISNRNQWTGIGGAPNTTYVSVQGPLGKSDYRTNATSFAVPGENPRGKQFWQDYTAPDPHHGIGFYAVTDKAGYINRWTVSATYAYHKPIGVRTTLAAGFNLGMSGINLDATKATFPNGDTQDPAIGVATGELRKVKPEIGAGLWLYSAKYFAGISVLNIVPAKAKFTTNNKYGTYYTPNYFATVGYRFTAGENFTVVPSVSLQYWQPQLLGVHTNAKLQYRDQAWVGASYRYSDFIAGYSAMAGYNFSNTVNVSYSYEVATNTRLRTYTGNTHEFVIGFTLGNKYSDACPRNIF
ncbi:PorP/SprF family type IX secretion system membrane protein [Ferruginibacter yonginensis]|uniref:PorP/SprF family type IX secretion system membrane protein n=1 Tax=Ferruginibacter yonginensis TaxID=1310416 RepID=A0ABV8QNE6_9BACT